MGLAETQRVLARLYTNSALRERFFADPLKVCRELGLSPDEAQQLARLSPQQVKLFASSLRNKRLQEVCELLPLTHRLLGDRMALLFRQYAETFVPQGIKKHREDAIAFAAYVEKIARAEKDIPGLLVDLLRYEKAWLETLDPARRLVVSRFRHAIGMLARRVAQGDEHPSPRVRPTIALWFRLTPRGRVRHIILSLPYTSR